MNATISRTHKHVGATTEPDWIAAGVDEDVKYRKTLPQRESARTSPDLLRRSQAPQSATRPKLPKGQALRSPRTSMLDIATFLDTVYRLSHSDEHKAVDAVFDFMDDRLLEDDFSACDCALDAIEPCKLGQSLVVSFLMVTRRAKESLPARATFLARAMECLGKDRGPEQAERLLGKYR